MKEFILKTKIDVNSCDACRRIKPSAFFTLFQNAASLHADELGMGYDALIKRRYLDAYTVQIRRFVATEL